METTLLSLLPFFLVHLAAMLPEVLVPLHVEFDQVTNFNWVDLPCATVANLKEQRSHGVLYPYLQLISCVYKV